MIVPVWEAKLSWNAIWRPRLNKQSHDDSYHLRILTYLHYRTISHQLYSLFHSCSFNLIAVGKPLRKSTQIICMNLEQRQRQAANDCWTKPADESASRLLVSTLIIAILLLLSLKAALHLFVTFLLCHVYWYTVCGTKSIS